MENQQLAAPLMVLARGNDRHVGIIRGIDGHDGHERWHFEMEHDDFVPVTALAADSGVVYAATSAGRVYAVRVSDGDLVWQHRVTGRHLYHRYPDGLRVVAGGGIVAVNYIRSDVSPTDTRHITVLNGQDGSELWVWHPPRYPHWVWLWQRWRRSNAPQQAGFVLLGADHQGVYLSQTFERHPTQSDWDRTILLHRRSGKPQWRTRQAAAANFAGHWGSRTSVALADDTAYTVGGCLSALDTSNGRARWSRPIPADVGRRPGPLVADESVLCAVRASDGEQLWQRPKAGGLPPLIAVAG
jgi:outer membrane protein assembly factor BamB